MTTKTMTGNWIRYMVDGTTTHVRGHYSYARVYKGWMIMLTDDGYNHPAWTISIWKKSAGTRHAHRTMNDYTLKTAKAEAMRLIDLRIASTIN